MDELLREVALLKDRIYDLELRHARHKHLGDVDQTQKLDTGGFLTGFVKADDFSIPTFLIRESKGPDASVVNGDAGDAFILGGAGNGTGTGMNFIIEGGAGGSTGTGGDADLLGGTGGKTSGNGGAAVLSGGEPDFGNGATGRGGKAQVTAGASNNGDGADVEIFGGDGYINSVGNGKGGNVYLEPGNTTGNSTPNDDGSVVLGLVNESATTANGNFVYIPTRNGVPTGTPATHTGTLPLVYDRANNDFYIYNGGWKKVHLA